MLINCIFHNFLLLVRDTFLCLIVSPVGDLYWTFYAIYSELFHGKGGWGEAG